VAACTRLAIALLAVSLHPAVSAQGQAAGDDPVMALRYSLKAGLLLSRLPDDPAVAPDRDSATGLFRFRVEPTLRWGPRVVVEGAYEQRVRLFSSTAAVAQDHVLPADAGAPFRIRQLDWQIASASRSEWRGEIDRAAARVHLEGADVTVGRQAIGWGRGALFGAVDLFAPFTPLEADREWRRGVDAIRADVKLGDRASIDSVAAFDRSLRRSAFATRLRGYAGKADLEILGGYRARDLFAGMATSAAVGDVELHGEFAVFRTPGVAGSLDFASPRWVTKAVAGGSYRIPAGSGVLVYGEYHYSGFGAASPELILANLADPAFQERYVRGDTQILGRHAAAVLASYEWSPEVSVSGEWLQSPVDRSGVIAPSMTWTGSDRWSVLLSGYVPYGSGPGGPTLQSQFGASPLGLFVQLRVYR
jgi:hypothetical protein